MDKLFDKLTAEIHQELEQFLGRASANQLSKSLGPKQRYRESMGKIHRVGEISCHDLGRLMDNLQSLLVLNVGNGWVAGGMGLLLLVTVDHSLIPY